jgi:hypothetical protein
VLAKVARLDLVDLPQLAAAVSRGCLGSAARVAAILVAALQNIEGAVASRGLIGASLPWRAFNSCSPQP